MTDQAGAATPEDTARQIVRCLEDGCRMTLEAPDGMTVSMIPAKDALAAWNTRTPDADWQPIETAPDGSVIFKVWFTDGRHNDVEKCLENRCRIDDDGFLRVWECCDFDGGEWAYARDFNPEWVATHWKPLDEPPKE